MTSRSYTLFNGCELLLEVPRYRAHVTGAGRHSQTLVVRVELRAGIYIWTDLARVKLKRVSGP
jgi:hypothetical protein